MKTHGDKIKTRILDAGVNLWPNFSARSIGRKVKMTHSAVLYHFGDIEHLREAVIKHAVEKQKSAIIVELIAQGHKAVKDMPLADRQRHMQAMC